MSRAAKFVLAIAALLAVLIWVFPLIGIGVPLPSSGFFWIPVMGLLHLTLIYLLVGFIKWAWKHWD